MQEDPRPHVALFSYARTKMILSCSCGWIGGMHSQHDRARRHWDRHVEQVERVGR